MAGMLASVIRLVMFDNSLKLIHERIFNDGISHFSGCRITYHCGEGYELVGKSERFCQATGDWFPKELPNCVRK